MDLNIYDICGMTGLDEESSVLALNKLNETQGFIGKAGLEG